MVYVLNLASLINVDSFCLCFNFQLNILQTFKVRLELILENSSLNLANCPARMRRPQNTFNFQNNFLCCGRREQKTKEQKQKTGEKREIFWCIFKKIVDSQESSKGAIIFIN